MELWADGAHRLHDRVRFTRAGDGLVAAEAQSLSEADDRLFPPRPILAVSTAVFRDGRALIARRAKAPWRGAFSLPGGVVEIGETLVAAAARELAEEVGVEAEIVGFVRHVEPIHREGERVRAHFVIAVFAARWRRGEPAPQRRGRRDRLGRSPRSRRPADDAGTARHSRCAAGLVAMSARALALMLALAQGAPAAKPPPTPPTPSPSPKPRRGAALRGGSAAARRDDGRARLSCATSARTATAQDSATKSRADRGRPAPAGGEGPARRRLQPRLRRLPADLPRLHLQRPRRPSPTISPRAEARARRSPRATAAASGFYSPGAGMSAATPERVGPGGGVGVACVAPARTALVAGAIGRGAAGAARRRSPPASARRGRRWRPRRAPARRPRRGRARRARRAATSPTGCKPLGVDAREPARRARRRRRAGRRRRDRAWCRPRRWRRAGPCRPRRIIAARGSSGPPAKRGRLQANADGAGAARHPSAWRRDGARARRHLGSSAERLRLGGARRGGLDDALFSLEGRASGGAARAQARRRTPGGSPRSAPPRPRRGRATWGRGAGRRRRRRGPRGSGCCRHRRGRQGWRSRRSFNDPEMRGGRPAARRPPRHRRPYGRRGGNARAPAVRSAGTAAGPAPARLRRG